MMEALVSFLEPIDGDDFQRPMPAVAEPDTLPGLEDELSSYLGHLGSEADEYLGLVRLRLVEMRYVDPPPRISVDGAAPDDAVCRLWLRLVDRDPEKDEAVRMLLADPVLAACMLAYVSDWTILDPVQVAIGKTWQTPGQHGVAGSRDVVSPSGRLLRLAALRTTLTQRGRRGGAGYRRDLQPGSARWSVP